MPFSKDFRKGKERADATRRAFDEAVQRWKDAPPEEKPKRAAEVMSHAGGMGHKLRDLIEDQEMAQKIVEDFKLSK